MTDMTPILPGEVLQLEFIEPLGLSQTAVALATGVPPRRINEIVHGTRRITADTALRLAKFFGTTAMFWMNLQTRYDLEIAEDTNAAIFEDIQPLVRAAA